MLKVKEKMSVRWSTQEAKGTTTMSTQNIETSTQQQIQPEKLQKPKDNDNEAEAEAALDVAKAALETAKMAVYAAESTCGRYVNWDNKHAELAAQPWCCIGDLMAFCDKYEFKSLNRNDIRTSCNIVAEIKVVLGGEPPFNMRRRFPGNIRNPENLWICIGRCASVEYHLNRILNAFRKPLEQLSADKQRIARQNFHLAVNELRLDISARVLDLRLYDRPVFEREFQLTWQADT